jgi:hypothetical protein
MVKKGKKTLATEKLLSDAMAELGRRSAGKLTKAQRKTKAANAAKARWEKKSNA